MSITTAHHSHAGENGSCVDVGELRRLNYFYGQMLSAQDFQIEQSFFRDKMKLHNRCLHGYGTVCGLIVEPVPTPTECPTEHDEEEKALREQLKKLMELKAARRQRATKEQPGPEGVPPADSPVTTAEPSLAGGPATAPEGPASVPTPDLDAQIAAVSKQLEDFYKRHCKKAPRTHLRITCGLALDCEGNELVLRKSLLIDPVARLSSEDYECFKRGASDIYVSLCYCEEPTDPVRPVLPDFCGATSGCAFSKTQDSVSVKVSLTPPKQDDRCGTCCERCDDTCLLLARIDYFMPGETLHESQIHNGVRRPLSTYQPTTITGISWKHGHTYTQEQAKRILGTNDDEDEKGLEIQFSREVRASTIHRGVIDLWVIEGGRGRAGNIYHKDGKFVHESKDGYVDRIQYRDTTGETLEPGDRVLIILRTDFILDHCCRPVDGEHVGGKVPLLPECDFHHRESSEVESHDNEPTPSEECVEPPGHPGPWTSGNGTPGGTFESWFYIREDERGYRKR
jgi:hypothetical protein